MNCFILPFSQENRKLRFCNLFLLIINIFLVSSTSASRSTNSTDYVAYLPNFLPLEQSYNISAAMKWQQIISHDFKPLNKRSIDASWTTVNWVGVGMAGFGSAGITLASISKYCCKKDPISGQDTFRDCGWSCVLASISTLLVVVGGSLATGNWPTEGAIGGLNPNNKRNIDYKNYTSINDMVENFNSIGLTVHDTWGNNYFEIGEKIYATNAWFRLHAPGLGPVANIYIGPENSYLTTTHPNDHMNNPRNRKFVDYIERYDSSFWWGGGLITSYCRYNKGNSDLTAPKDINIIFPAINSLQHVFTEVYGPYHWIINDNNHSNRHIAEGILSYSGSYDGTRPGSPPTGGVPSVCYGDHDEL